MPKGRVAAFRTLVYLFVAADLRLLHRLGDAATAAVPGNLYQPLLIGRLLQLPTPTPLLVNTIFWALIPLSRCVAATGRRTGCSAGPSSSCTSSG